MLQYSKHSIHLLLPRYNIFTYKQCRELQGILKVLLGRIRIPLYANANVINEGRFSKNILEARTGRILHR